MTTWLITGCSSGLGRDLAQDVLRRGHNAVITARHPDSLKDLVKAYPGKALPQALDVTNRDQIATAVHAAETQFGRIDVLVNNAGYGYRAAIEEGDEADVAALFATNVFGPVSVMKAVLPGMRKRRAGTIVNISSVAPRIASPGSGYYSASKLALEGISATLRKEVTPLGIKVMVVQPGAFRTNFAGRSLHGSETVIADYDSTVGPRRKAVDKTSGKELGDPIKAAHVLVDVITGQKLPDNLLLGSDAVTWATNAIKAEIQEIEKWKAVSTSTDRS
ncbi:oxidoreductase [Gluconacetobacter sp. Hr-1-5]|uniref:oxidoreductase n=1 Tax=Gluconacetobacter sp. Hr-1-5 TaxID=3395370 RepID=UPI003B529364